MVKAIVHSIKHYFHTPAAVIGSGGLSTTTAVNAITKGAARANAFDVEEGCLVKAVFFEYWLSGVTVDKTATWIVLKRPANVAAPTFAQMANLGTYPNKKNILTSGQGLMPTNGNVMNILKGWIMIPKGKQRFGLGDKLELLVAAVATNVNICGLLTFKEYE